MAQLDWERFLERLERNESLALELATDLYNVIDTRFQAVVEAIESRDLPRIAKTTHALRGLLAPYGAMEILSVLKKTEESARAGEPHSGILPDTLKPRIQELKAEIKQTIDSPST